MRSVHKILATAVATAALIGGAFVPPAAADPSNGEGCAGVPSVPAAYVCVISVTPTEALPDTSTGSIPVTVPAICYVAGCTSDTTVNVPVPGAQPGSGNIAVLWYGGTYYPIGVGIGGAIFPIVQDAIELVDGVLGTAAGVVATVNDIINNAPTTGELVDAVVEIVEDRIGGYLDTVRRVLEEYPEIIARLVEIVQERLDDFAIQCSVCS